MYGTDTEPYREVCRDPWQRNRYGVRLSAYLASDLEDVGAALERMGYEAGDVDQWGRSYVHPLDPRREAEVDEGLDFEGEVRLILSRYGLEASETDGAADELRQIYDRLVAETAAEAGVYGCEVAT